MTFEVGDRVRIKADQVGVFGITQPGSEGVVEFGGDNYNLNIRFSKLTCPDVHLVTKWINTCFRIPPRALELIPEWEEFEIPTTDPILQRIWILHHRQKFYQTHKKQLPSWH